MSEIISRLLPLLKGLLFLIIMYAVTTALGHLAYKTRKSRWGLVLILAVPLILAGGFYYMEAGWKLILIPSVIVLGIMVLGRIGIIIGAGMFED